ncbi:VWA domain-containing protein [Romboutsia ilealis]|uniref:VWA domain-containing protein n=1 Tax=Romboutsia faecis TaxID=2764597 RepID=A0ABR7JLN0_9FIRM|nr:vWA domain-containing protein [Romboutsia faecis]MBC5995832.1 VWA domain-containing protein [Romboutsia faecis]MRN23031.1 VWA domain-containing protein [Romboutsia ilealis]
MKKISKKISSLLVGCLTLGMLSSPLATAETSTPKGFIKTESGLYIKKSVSKVENTDNQYRISFDISGTAPKVAMPTAEIVLVIDRSGSMKDTDKEQKITKVKNAAKNFCKTILDGKGDNVKISIVSYASSASLDIKSSNNLNNLSSKINYLKADGGTNTEEGIKEAKNIISNINADKKYVVLFTDGLPTYNTYYADKNYMDEDGNYYKYMPNPDKNSTDLLRLGNRGSATYNNDIMAAQRAYHDIVGGTGKIGGIAPRRYYQKVNKDRGGYEYDSKDNKESQTEELTSKDISSTADPNIKFYTMGLFTNSTYSIREVADNIDESINNYNVGSTDDEYVEPVKEDTTKEIVDLTENKVNKEDMVEEEVKIEEIKQSRAKYDFSGLSKFDPGESDMAKSFLYSIQNAETSFDKYVNNYYTSSTDAMTNIFSSIAKEISGELNAYLGKDVVIKDTVTGDFSIVDININDIQGIDKDKISINGNNIEFNLGDVEDINEDLSNPDKTISFVIEVNDPYLFGEDIPTNVKAAIDHTNPINPNERFENEEFNIPHVTIDPKKAKITVKKVVQNPDNLTPSENMSQEVFPILIQGNEEQYSVGLKADETETMTVYLKGNETNISSEYAEKYKENENYKFDKNLNFLTVGGYSVSEIVPMNYELVSISNQNFNINKDNNEINIVITNKCINDRYFHDNHDKANKLEFK